MHSQLNYIGFLLTVKDAHRLICFCDKPLFSPRPGFFISIKINCFFKVNS